MRMSTAECEIGCRDSLNIQPSTFSTQHWPASAAITRKIASTS